MSKAKETTAPIPRLYNEALQEVRTFETESISNEEVVSNFQTLTSIKRLCITQDANACHKFQPPEMIFLLKENGQLHQQMNVFLLSTDGEENKIITLATDKMLERLSTANIWYIDGTFKFCPSLFYQLFTINIFVEEQQVPAVYMLLPGKSRLIYDKAFLSLKQAMQERDLDFEPLEILVDFELALHQSIRLHFPGTLIRSCYFHFNQALWIWVQINGHSVLYKENEPFRSFIQCSSAIPFLPVSYLRLAWRGLKSSVPEQPQYSDFIAYFERTWIYGVLPLKMWNQYDNAGPRTNNNLESWHNRLNRLAMKSHPNFFEMIELLKNEEATTEVSVTKLRSGALPRPKKKKKKTAKINKRLKRKFKKGKISVDIYIRSIGYIFGL